MAATSEPPAKRLRLAYHHRHRIQHGLQTMPDNTVPSLPNEAIDKLMFNSIRVICEEEAGRKGISEPVVESVALESLHNAAEEYALKLCMKIQRSMMAARRTVPIATDFETAIDVLNVPCPHDQLRQYDTKPDINPRLLPTPPPDDPFHNHVELSSSFLGPDLSNQNDLKKLSFSTAGLPALPSAHTYKNSHVFHTRETDSRRIRELATEEGKLGEQALRKLAGAVKLDTALSMEPESRTVRARHGRRRRQPLLTEEAVFEETMRDLLKTEAGKFELGPIVTSEKGYRMPDEAQIRRRLTNTGKSSSDHPPTTSSAGGVTGLEPMNVPSKYNVLPPPRRESTRPERMDTS